MQYYKHGSKTMQQKQPELVTELDVQELIQCKITGVQQELLTQYKREEVNVHTSSR
jgi:hypothetical protein